MNISQLLQQIETVKAGDEIKKLNKLRLRVQQKIAFPFVCLVFGVVGAALGTRPQRSDKATSFGLSVVIIFGYYLLRFITEALGLSGIFSPFMGAWLPNLFGLMAGGLMIVRAAR